MQRSTLIWFDMTLATQHAEVEKSLTTYFDVEHCNNIYHPEEQFDLDRKIGLCFEFDYPDRPGLEVMRSTKERYPHLPVLMLTAQHSERLAIWAYRNRVFDFLVKPLADEDLERCHKLLSAMQTTERSGDNRAMFEFRSTIPAEIPVGQRSIDVRLAPAIHYVEKNFRGKIRNAEVAELCDMSIYHFTHEFTETFSLTFQDFVIRYRILQACRELRHPNVAVSNVAYSVGFNDPSYFSRGFRRHVGCSPTEFGENLSNGGPDQCLTDAIAKLDLPDVGLLSVDRREQQRRHFELARRQR